MPDTRIYFAAERTLLAWVRTGLTVMALGFVVARFGLFLTLVAASGSASAAAGHGSWPSSLIGIALVVVGTGTILGALHNHRQYVPTIPPADVPRVPLPWLSTFLSLAVAAVGALMAAYLAFA